MADKRARKVFGTRETPISLDQLKSYIFVHYAQCNQAFPAVIGVAGSGGVGWD